MTCSFSQPLALTAGNPLLSLVSHPLGRLDKFSQPYYLISLADPGEARGCMLYKHLCD